MNLARWILTFVSGMSRLSSISVKIVKYFCQESISHSNFRDGFFNPDMLYQTKMIDEMMRGLVSTPMEFMDQFMSGEITNHLFEEKNIPKSGLDLAALNIQRGRDHGLKSYNEYRVACNLKRAHNFDDLAGEINQVDYNWRLSVANVTLEQKFSVSQRKSFTQIKINSFSPPLPNTLPINTLNTFITTTLTTICNIFIFYLLTLKRFSLLFNTLTFSFCKDVIKRLKQIYFSVEDIDLFTGGLSEVPLKGALVGPTFACIIGIQFQKAKKCDRFWYETSDAAVRFTESQLTEIRKATLAKIVCENADVVDKIQKSAFDQYHEFLNERVPCRSLPQINLQLWKDEAHKCKVDGIDIPLGASRRISPCTSCTCTRENAQCQSLRVNNCRQLISEVGVEAVRRDNICKTQCTFALNSPPPVNNVVNDGTLTAPLPPTPQRPSLPLSNVPPRPAVPIRQLPPRPPRQFFPPPAPASVQPSGGRLAPVSVPAPPPPVGGIGGQTPPVVPVGAPGSGPGSLRQPRPLFAFPNIRLPNLSDLFGL